MTAANISRSLLMPRSYHRHLLTQEQFKQVEDRFWRRVIKRRSCLVWTGSYAFTVDRVNYVPRRVAWVLAYGDIPVELDVTPICNNMLCVNVDHLILWGRGDRNSYYQLQRFNPLRLDAIREFHPILSVRQIADKFGLSVGVVSSILKNETYKDSKYKPNYFRFKKVSPILLQEMKKRFADGESVSSIARRYQIGYSTAYELLHGVQRVWVNGKRIYQRAEA